MITSNRKTEVNIDDTLNDLGGKKVPTIMVTMSGTDMSANIITPIIFHPSLE